MATGEAVVCFQDAELNAEEIEILEGDGWLNDRIIRFFFTIYQHQLANNHPELLFVDPAVASAFVLSAQDKEDLEEFSKGLELEKKNLLFVPVNDKFASSFVCTHWSLLIVNKEEQLAIHLDSMGESNLEAAKIFLNLYNKVTLQDIGLTSSEAPQQKNSNDCGMFTILLAEWYLKKHLNKLASQKSAHEIFSEENIKAKRKLMARIVRSTDLERASKGFI